MNLTHTCERLVRLFPGLDFKLNVEHHEIQITKRIKGAFNVGFEAELYENANKPGVWHVSIELVVNDRTTVNLKTVDSYSPEGALRQAIAIVLGAIDELKAESLVAFREAHDPAKAIGKN